MKLDRFLRLAVGFLVLLVFVIAIAAMLFVTESFLNVWDRLIQGPKIILWGYIGVMSALVIAAIWLIARLVVKRNISPEKIKNRSLRKEDIEARLQDAERSGVNVEDAQAELQNLAERRNRDQCICVSSAQSAPVRVRS
jgi:membrane protein implicated in regulation of membrane protease activity